MSKWILAIIVTIFGATFVATEADAAKRTGGGKNVGVQRNVTAPPAKAAPQGTQQAAPSQGTPAQPNPAAAASPASKWGGILGGLALGGMLGYLLGGGGLGAVGNILMIALLAFAAVFIVRALLSRRAGGTEREQPAQLAGMQGETMTPPPSQPQTSYGGQVAASPAVNVPAGFDAAGFLRGARMNFMKLQLANDRGELREIQEFTTPEMYEALKQDIVARNGKQETDIMSVDADLLELVTEGDQYWASVRFSGMERERPGGEAQGFEEVWNLVKPTNGSSGWLLAGIQQMH
jgi:predicted lipid-binding transport protein (Tim44 family)